DGSQIDAAAAGRSFYLSLAVLHLDTAAPGFKKSSLQSIEYDDAAAASLGHNFAFGGCHMDAAAAGLQVEISAGCAHINAAAARAGVDAGANAVQLQSSATTGGIHAAGDVRHRHIATVGFDFGQLQRLGDLQGKIRGELASVPP